MSKTKQHTIANEISLSGVGLHTGVNTTVCIKPAPENNGIVFIRTDISPDTKIPALAEFVVETSRSTIIGKGDAKISTIEHCLAAVWGSEIDNAIIEVNGPEIPILDGSAKNWVEAIKTAGITEQNANRKYFEILSKLEYKEEESGVEIIGLPDNKTSFKVNVEFKSKVVGMQYATISSEQDFIESISHCRTFAFYHELKPLIDQNLIKGGDLDNAIVILEEGIDPKQENEFTKYIDKTSCDVTKPGYIAEGGLRFENEIARHKALDLYGDLALCGRRLIGCIIATKPGHKANTEFAKLLRKEIKASESLPPIQYNPNLKPELDINDIKKRLPHRPPFLLVDKIMEVGKEHVIGVKQVTMNEPFFVGHFPEEPVMPGVLQIEAMAQCGGILALNNVDDPENYSTYFMKIDNCKFKRKVVPGDTILFSLVLSEPIRRGIVAMTATAYVGDEICCEAELMAMVTTENK